MLDWVAERWATPTTKAHRKSERAMRPHADGGESSPPGIEQQAEAMITRWATPRASDAEKGGPNQKFGEGGEPLTAQAVKWTTPSAGDGHRGGIITDSMSGTSLTQQVNSLWRTPRSNEVGGYQYERGDKSKPTPTVTGQASNLASFLPDRPISTDGEESSHIRRSLNPQFVEWLMGWPPGWTLLGLMPPASTGSACSATALSAWKRRMRCALLSLALSDAAPPAQLSLLG